MSAAIPLNTVQPNGSMLSHPKGLWPWRPQASSRLLVERITECYQMLNNQNALPAGPRTIGYRLKETYRGEYTKADFDLPIGRAIKRMTQARMLPFEWVSDASEVTHLADGWESPADFLRDIHRYYKRDRRENQPVVAEIYAEAKETLGLIVKLARESGATVYSGSGSCGPGLARKVATRALIRAVEQGQDTMILGVCDFDSSGVETVMRPHIEHVAAFLYGPGGNKEVLSFQGKQMADTGCSAGFRHLGMTPEMALERAEIAELTEADQAATAAYIASGEDLWDRDISILKGVAKFELEVLDPDVLRELVTDALSEVLDDDELERISDEEESERGYLDEVLGDLADGLEEE